MICVFKTSVITGNDIERLRSHLNQLPQSKWNFDLEDCDKILRIVTEKEISRHIIRILRDHGFVCEELSD